VATVNEFQEALRAGARHIEITQHLDLTNEEVDEDYDYGTGLTLKLLPSSWSIRVSPPCASVPITVDEYVHSKITHLIPERHTQRS
jgi:hypothetical protein